MVVAGGNVAYQIGSNVGMVLWPVAGALLLFFGVRRRIAHRRWVRQENQRLLRPQPSGPDPTSPLGAAGRPADAGVPLSKPRGGGIVMIIVGVIVLVVGLLDIAARAVQSGSPESSGGLAVGQCIAGDDYVSGPADVQPQPVDCDRPEATLEVVIAGDGSATCPDGKRQGSEYATLISPSRTLCLALNAQEGRCYVRTSKVLPTACADPKANVKIAKRIDGSTDESACDSTAVPVVYREPARVYCVEAP